MFDFTSSKLLLLGIVALLVIGPKDLPALLRTLGKYMGIIRRHATDFRAQFDEAIRESELHDLKKEVETMGQEAEQSIRSAEQSVQGELDAARTSVDSAMDDPAQKFTDDALTPDADALPAASTSGAGGTSAPLNGAHPPEPEPAAAGEPAVETAQPGPQPGQVPDKSGA